MRNLAASGLAIAAVLSLPACGGSGDAMSGRALGLGEIRDLAGLSAPVETGTAQQERRPDVIARADSLVVSTMHIEVAGPDAARALRRLSECSGPQCDLLDPVTGETDAISLDTFRTVRGDAEAIGSAHGVTLTSESAQRMGVDRTSLGAWMEHASFGLINDHAIAQGIESTSLYALAQGDLTGRPPAGSATWLGIMVGTPTAGDDRGERLVGTAALNYDMAAGAFDAAFSGIHNIDRGMVHGVEVVIFSNLAFGPDGTFSRGQSGARIQGGFYGPGHAEAAGIFEQANIAGAFGATRQ